MRIDARIFVDDREVIVLIDDIEWHILRFECHILYFPLYLDHIASVYFFIFVE